MYFVNWQREISIAERAGQKVVVKRDKPTKEFHEYLLVGVYTLISFLLAHPSPPLSPAAITRNEDRETREMLALLGIPTPALVSIAEGELVEEYVEGGDLYRALACGTVDKSSAPFAAGVLTGRLHSAGYVFTDNKAQNYLVREGGTVLRTDLAFLQKSNSTFAQSMDIGSFLASVVDLESYPEIECAFFDGYHSAAGSNFPYLSIVLRNILSAGFSSDSRMAVRNLMRDSSRLLGIC